MRTLTTCMALAVLLICAHTAQATQVVYQAAFSPCTAGICGSESGETLESGSITVYNTGDVHVELDGATTADQNLLVYFFQDGDYDYIGDITTDEYGDAEAVVGDYHGSIASGLFYLKDQDHTKIYYSGYAADDDDDGDDDGGDDSGDCTGDCEGPFDDCGSMKELNKQFRTQRKEIQQEFRSQMELMTLAYREQLEELFDAYMEHKEQLQNGGGDDGDDDDGDIDEDDGDDDDQGDDWDGSDDSDGSDDGGDGDASQE